MKCPNILMQFWAASATVTEIDLSAVLKDNGKNISSIKVDCLKLA